MHRPYFTKLVLPSTIRDKILRIPGSFLRKYGHELMALARLIVPDGRIWQVGLRKSENKVWFHDGWREFMDRFSINVGYFLVFGYEGNCTFRIYIFNLPSSEINYQMRNMGGHGELGGRSAFIFEEMEDDDSIETVIMPPPSVALENKVYYESSNNKLNHSKNYPPALQNLFNGSTYHSSLKRAERQILQVPVGADGTNTPVQSARETGFQVSPFEQKSYTGEVKMFSVKNEPGSPKETPRKRKKSDPSKQGSSSLNEEDDDAHYRFYESASARKRTVAAEERERALNAAKAFEPENPFCRVVVRPSYLYRGCIMYLPSCFAEKHLNGISGFIKLQRRDGRQWPVRCLYRGGRAKLSQGWYEFALENNLGEGDVCIFEILNTRDVIIQVTMFRVMEDAGLMNPPVLHNVYHSKLIN